MSYRMFDNPEYNQENDSSSVNDEFDYSQSQWSEMREMENN